MTAPPRVGLFGLLGSGNLGNDGSLEALLGFLRERHPDAEVDFMCGGAEQVTARYGLPAVRLHWYRGEYRTASGVGSVLLKLFGKLIDVVRTAAWVRRHDVVIVPGMGVLEATLPLRPWGFPYSLFLLCASGRLLGTKVALVSVGADLVANPVTRWLVVRAARSAHYRSYRDTVSLDALTRMGLDTSGDTVYPDLAFALPVPTAAVVEGSVGVGVMVYRGGAEDRAVGDQIYADYVAKLQRFVRWLVDQDRRVTLFTGDRADDEVVARIIDDVRAQRPDVGPDRVVPAAATTLGELLTEMAAVELVVATRYHNVLSALKLSKPTVSIGYSGKHEALMADVGLAGYSQSARDLDVEYLIEQLTRLESDRQRVTEAVTSRNGELRERLDQQFEILSRMLVPLRDQVTVH